MGRVLNGGWIYLLTLVIRFMGGLLLHFFVVKIKGEDETLGTLNFILKLFRPSFANLVKNLFGSSPARSLYIGYLYGSQPKKCQNRVPIDRFL